MKAKIDPDILAFHLRKSVHTANHWANSIKVSVELPKTEKQNLSTRFTRKSWKKISEELPKIPSQSWKKRKTQQVAVQSMGDNR